MAKDAKFAEIRKNVEEAAKNNGIIKLADIRKKSKVEGKDKKKPSKGSTDSEEKKEKEMEAPLVQEGINVAVDYVTFTTPAE